MCLRFLTIKPASIPQSIETSLVAQHQAGHLEALFEQCFFDSYNTRLCGGGEEPVYLPAELNGEAHRLIYREDFFASALHEIAHWCIAGAQRRTQTDFGYWYAPDGRDAGQQRAFEQAEIKPQALEWIFSEAAGLRFQVSVDNLNGPSEDEQSALESFRVAVWQQVWEYCEQGLPERAGVFAQALERTFGIAGVLDVTRYSLDETTEVSSSV